MQAHSRRPVYLIMFCITVATLSAYAGVPWFGFTGFDDPAYVTDNPHVRSGLAIENLRWAFGIDRTTGNWHPLTWISLMTDASLFHASAAGYHVMNVVLHLASALLLFTVLGYTTGLLWRAGAVAALFALHPQHVESVAWISERKDTLSTLLLMLTLAAYSWYARKPGIKRYAVVLLAFALGLTAKPMLVSVPLLLILFDWWPLKRVAPAFGGADRFPTFGLKTIVLEKLPFAVLAAGSCIVTKMAQGSGSTVTPSGVIPFADRVVNAIMSYGIYIAKTFWPSGLACYYPHPWSWPAWKAASVLLSLIAVTFLCLRYAGRLRYLAVGWLWYVISLVPVIGLVQVGLQARADRYSYIPLIGIFIIAAYGLPDLLNRFKQSPALVRALRVAAIAIFAAFGGMSYRQAGFWKDSVSLYSRALAVTENNWFAHNGMGITLRLEAERLAHSGDRQEALARYRAAMGHFQETIRILPQYADAHNSLAVCLNALGDSDGALSAWRKAVAIDPAHFQAHYNLGNLFLQRGQADEAIDYYRRAIRLDPLSAAAHYNLGRAFTSQRRFDEAENEYRTVLKLDPEPYYNYWTHNNLAVLMQLKGQSSEAIRLLERAVRLNEATGVDTASDAARMNLRLFRKKP